MRGRGRSLTALALTGALLVLGACSSSYHRASFSPAPAVVTSEKDPRMRTLASILGIRKADEDQGIPARVETRVRVENLSQVEATIHATDFRLLTSDLTELLPAETGVASITVPAGGNGTIDVNFPLPADTTPERRHFSGLDLRILVRTPGAGVAMRHTFKKDVVVYYHDWYPWYDRHSLWYHHRWHRYHW